MKHDHATDEKEQTPFPWKAGPVFGKEGRAIFWTDTSNPGKWQRRVDDKSGVFTETDAKLIESLPTLIAQREELVEALRKIEQVLAPLHPDHHHYNALADAMAKVARVTLAKVQS